MAIDAFSKGKHPSESLLQNYVAVWEMHGLVVIVPKDEWQQGENIGTFPLRNQQGGYILCRLKTVRVFDTAEL